LGAFKRNYKQFQPSLGLSSAGLDSGSKLVGRKRDGMVDKEKMITESESLKLVLEKKAEEEKDEEIDLGDSGDVVVSWKRIEQVFGTVR
jgi:tetrahydromethanopterin S-methyltransferase subunit A